MLIQQNKSPRKIQIQTDVQQKGGDGRGSSEHASRPVITDMVTCVAVTLQEGQ